MIRLLQAVNDLIDAECGGRVGFLRSRMRTQSCKQDNNGRSCKMSDMEREHSRHLMIVCPNWAAGTQHKQTFCGCQIARNDNDSILQRPFLQHSARKAVGHECGTRKHPM